MTLKTIVVTLAAAAAFACGSGPPDLTSQAGPSPVVLTDTSAGQLSVAVGLNMGGYDSASRDKATIDVFMQQEGRPVKFVAGERVDCGGSALTPYTGSFEVTVSTVTIAGALVTCTYTSGQQSVQFRFRVPEALVIVSPREHEQMPRSPRTLIGYKGGPGPTLWVVAIGTSAKAVAQPDAITTTSAAIDTTKLGVGDGSIALTDPNNFALTEIEGSQFRSIVGTARRETSVSVVWL
jgi:hypothetical protein